MKDREHNTIFRKDYIASAYLIDTIHLLFKLDPEKTVVITTTHFKSNPAYSGSNKQLRLDGEDLKLLEIKKNGTPLSTNQYVVDEKSLTILQPESEFSLEITTEINPQGNSSLNGLYRTNSNYCSQCEAEGFRRITYYLDRPDILAQFVTRIEADKASCPVLLSNGNLIDKGELSGDKHFAVWQDPFPKPCYLFALVAGDLVCIEDSYTTVSGKKVSLQFFVESQNKDQCDHAMNSLQKAMKWDEQVYGLEYDLDIYMIVAVDDFNMGAMENKGLNIFNSKYVLALPETATDQDYLGIEGVIAHEYFHNWTGNRVTCRDWFQLSLKEGLTVFRDQEFSSDMNSKAVKRIDDVKILRNYQFREDSGPMAHPIRPDSYVEINNFYTVTVYNKGAEVVRMIHHIIGAENFRKGMDLYFERFDGQAVTCEDFVQSMADASQVDLTKFRRWYSQSGTPVITVEENWNEEKKQYSIKLQQHCDATPGQENKEPFHIPIEIGLLHPDIQPSESDIDNAVQEYQIDFDETDQEYLYNSFDKKPVLSFLRGFSAPVKVKSSQSRDELAFLMSHDTDSFNKWDASNTFSILIVNEVMESLRKNETLTLDKLYLDAFRHNLLDEKTDKALIAQALSLPSEIYLAQQMEIVEPDLIHKAVKFIRKTIATQLNEELRLVYDKNIDNTSGYLITPEAMGQRSLKNCSLSYLMAIEEVDDNTLQLCLDQYSANNNMTDVVAALLSLTNYPGAQREKTFNHFFTSWKDNPLVLDKWFTLQAISNLETTQESVKNLMKHQAFSMKNPNKVRSLIGAFCTLNHVRFHDDSGAGYRFLTDCVLELDQINSQVASRLVSSFTSFRKYKQKLKAMMQEQLQFISIQKNLSPDVYEIVEKCLESDR